ncbi:alcohol dehydrogenase catalytic domain-containing protein [Microlunatus parietis]|uniref:alcohol dehydrogenase n=1 Tax=Microlunatus parietis TaxID=682979 RepID=A0A7Y9IDV5_9ACTN|nr:alcohol dehydrogenase catalytic domain-containing protein [Microlunatus parietis]NYE74708.1 putative phosphonate catabolism associated alcohol dehydrogenase [Microlunatus parietis]
MTHAAAPGSVQVAVFDQGKVELRRIELPARAAGEIDVDVTAAAICGSDLHTVLGHRSAPPATALGHEGVGRVSAVDPGATDLRGDPLRAGDRVVLSMIRSCGRCDRCRAGLTMKCRFLFKYGHASVTEPPYASGTLATRIRISPGVPVLRIPDRVDDSIMVPAGCATATAAAVVTAAAPTGDEPVLIFGAGAVGLYCAAMLAGLGCAVVVRDPSEQRLAMLSGTGAVPDDGAERPYPIVVEASGSPAAFADALTAVDLGGRVIGAGSVSLDAGTVTVDPALLVTRRIRFTGVHNYTPDEFCLAVDWLAEHGDRLDLGRLVSPPQPLTKITEAFTLMQSGTYPRVLVRP